MQGRHGGAGAPFGGFLELHGQLCCLTISREIADLKMTQRELVAAREAALAASRAKSEFLSSMSHEIRTPMNSILGMADLLMETTLSDEQRRYLSTVISNGHALLALINSILDLAKVESGRISLEAVEFDLKDVTEKVLETLAIRAHEKGLELMVRFAPEVPGARARRSAEARPDPDQPGRQRDQIHAARPGAADGRARSGLGARRAGSSSR